LEATSGETPPFPTRALTPVILRNLSWRASIRELVVGPAEITLYLPPSLTASGPQW